jgi:hypothetical protein
MGYVRVWNPLVVTGVATVLEPNAFCVGFPLPLHHQTRHHFSSCGQLLSQTGLILCELRKCLCCEFHLGRHLHLRYILCFELGTDEIHTLLELLPARRILLCLLLHGIEHELHQDRWLGIALRRHGDHSPSLANLG